MKLEIISYVYIVIQIILLVYVFYSRQQIQRQVRKNLPPIFTLNQHPKEIDMRVDLRKPVNSSLPEPTRPAILPLNIEQDIIPNYQQLGFVHQENSESLPLYGRAKYQGSNTYEYYVKDGSRNGIRIPIETERKNNNELQDEDIIQIKSLEGDYEISMYPRETIRYIPYIY